MEQVRSKGSRKEEGILPPHSKEIEEVVIGAMLVDPKIIPIVMQNIDPVMFYFDMFEKLCTAIYAIFNQGGNVDTITVFQECKSKSYGVSAYDISKLTSRIASSANTETHMAILKDKYDKRTLISMSNEVQQACYLDFDPALSIVEQVASTLNEVSSIKRSATLSDQVLSAMKYITKPNGGCPTGNKVFDEQTGGLLPGELVILAGRPGMGKTAKMINIVHSCLKKGLPCAIFEHEMSTTALLWRLASIISGVPGWKIRKNYLDENDWKSLNFAFAQIEKMPLYIEDSGMAIDQIVAYCTYLNSKHQMGVVAVDHLQIQPVKSKFGTRDEEIGYISSRLKMLSKKTACPVLALSQLNREVEKRSDKRPQLSDLRGSGSLEQDADMVIGLYRPSYYYDFEKDPEYGQGNCPVPYDNLVETHLLKFREGSLFSVQEELVLDIGLFRSAE